MQRNTGYAHTGANAVVHVFVFHFFPSRRDRDGDKAGGGDGARALAQLLTLMDGFHKAEGSHVLAFGATNRSREI